MTLARVLAIIPRLRIVLPFFMNTFKKLVPALALFLVACGGTPQAFILNFDLEDAAKKNELVLASERVVERRLESLGEKPDADIVEGEPVKVSFSVKEPTSFDSLSQSLTGEFKLRVMVEAPAGTPGAVQIENQESFVETGITEEDIQWMTWGAGGMPGDPSVPADESLIDPALIKGHVTIQFTEAGREKMKDLFAKNNRKFIGIFVRDQLVSKLLVDTDVLIDDIIISDVPSLELAQIFVDDMNVGLHVTFVPEK